MSKTVIPFNVAMSGAKYAALGHPDGKDISVIVSVEGRDRKRGLIRGYVINGMWDCVFTADRLFLGDSTDTESAPAAVLWSGTLPAGDYNEKMTWVREVLAQAAEAAS